MKSRWEGILVSIFLGFWWVWGAKLGGGIGKKSIQKGIGKMMEKRRAPGWTESRNMTPQGSPAPGVHGPGEVSP